MDKFLGTAAAILGVVAILGGGLTKAAETWPTDWYWFARITRYLRPFIYGCVVGVALSLKFLLVSPNGRAFTICGYLVSGLAMLALLVQIVDAYHKARSGADDSEADR